MGRIGRATTLAAAGVLVAAFYGGPLTAPATASSTSRPAKFSCATSRTLCTEVEDPESAFGEDVYVGHDEPSTLFYSNAPGSGNNVRYDVTLPTEPAGDYSTAKSYDFQLRATFWFGMAMCDTQSYPETVPHCTPDSDSNIVDPATSDKHPGVAFMELQLYPPGFVQQFAGFSCDPTRWCAALTIDSLSENPDTGKTLNPTCTGEIGSIEYVNFAYLTLDGTPQGPPDPLHFDAIKSGKPGPNVLYMGQGDRLHVTMHDTANGLLTQIDDLTSGQTGSMTASAANGFGQIQFNPGPSKVCHEIPYDFHPMYSTSSEQTRVIWAAHSYNVAFSDEIGHFDFCSHIDPATGSCDGQEGPPNDLEAADGDDNACFSAAESSLYPTNGCEDSNVGFDGPSYLPLWPDGSSAHPTAALFSSPTTGSDYTTQFDRVAFEYDLPRIEAADFGGSCDRNTGTGCTQIPPTDDGAPAAFYPYFSTVSADGGCLWGIGSTLPGTISDFGANAQEGPTLRSNYLAFGGHGKPTSRINDFRNVMDSNPCPQP